MQRADTNALQPFRRLLVPTDFSRGAELALGRALTLPLAAGARIQLLHVLPPSLPAKLRANALSAAKRALERVASRVRKSSPGRHVTPSAHVLTGAPFVEIIRWSRNHGSELIVIGRHGQRPVRDMFIGSTAQRVIRKGDVPVLAVRGRSTGAYRRPLITTDLEDASHRTFELALRVLGPTPPRVDVVHAFAVPFAGFIKSSLSAREQLRYRQQFKEQAKRELAALLGTYAGVGVEWRTVIRAGDARSVALAEMARRHSDLIALGTHGRSGVAHALVGSVAEWLIEAAPCDVLVARPVRFSFRLP
jgi:nucleotide-binding universal stress UspA family protein